MPRADKLRHKVLALVPRDDSPANSQIRHGAIASVCRHLPGGIGQFIDLARLAKSSEPKVTGFLDAWEELDTPAQCEPSSADALCAQIGLDPLVILRAALQSAIEISALTSGLIAAVALPEVVETGICSALEPKGHRDREMFLQHSGFLPVPRGATVGVFNQIGPNVRDPSYVPFEQDILELDEASDETADAASRTGAGHTR